MRQSSAMEDQIAHQEMEIKKVLGIKENLVLETNQNQLVLETIQNILEKKYQKVHQLV